MIEESIKKILLEIEENAALDGSGELREGLKNTPKRVVESWKELYSGYKLDPKEFHSTCEHHMLSFTGKAHVAYIPTKRIVGISKLARIVEVFSRRLQNQERITTQVADALEKYLKPLGAAIIIEAKHECMGCRGVKKNHATMTTSAMRGVFFDKAEARSELMDLIKN